MCICGLRGYVCFFLSLFALAHRCAGPALPKFANQPNRLAFVLAEKVACSFDRLTLDLWHLIGLNPSECSFPDSTHQQPHPGSRPHFFALFFPFSFPLTFLPVLLVPIIPSLPRFLLSFWGFGGFAYGLVG